MSKACINDVLRSPDIDFHDFRVVFRIDGNDRSDMKADAFHSLRDFKQTVNILPAGEITVYDFRLIRQITG